MTRSELTLEVMNVLGPTCVSTWFCDRRSWGDEAIDEATAARELDHAARVRADFETDFEVGSERPAAHRAA